MPKTKGGKKKKGKKKGVQIATETFSKLLQYISCPAVVEVDDSSKSFYRQISIQNVKDLIHTTGGSDEADKKQARSDKEQVALVNGFDKEGKFKGKPLRRAVQLGDVEICKVLIESKAQVYTENLIDAIKMQCFDTVSFLLESEETVDHILRKQTYLKPPITPAVPPPHHAALKDDARIMGLILDKINPKDANLQISNKADRNAGMAPLHMAAERGHVDVVRTLLLWQKMIYVGHQGDEDVPWKTAFCVDCDICDAKGSTPLGIAAETGQLGVVKALVMDGLLAQLRWKCGFHGDARALDWFLSKKASVNQGLTPVQWAAYRGDYPMIEFLVGQGLDYDVDDVKANWFPPVIGKIFDPDLHQIMKHEFSPRLLKQISTSVFRGERTYRELKMRREEILQAARNGTPLRNSKFCSYICMVIAAYDVCWCDEDHILAKLLATEERLRNEKEVRAKRLAAEAQAAEEAERQALEEERVIAAIKKKKMAEAAAKTTSALAIE